MYPCLSPIPFPILYPVAEICLVLCSNFIVDRIVENISLATNSSDPIIFLILASDNRYHFPAFLIVTHVHYVQGEIDKIIFDVDAFFFSTLPGEAKSPPMLLAGGFLLPC